MENQDTQAQPSRPAQPDPCPPCQSKAQAFIENIKRFGQALQEYRWLFVFAAGCKVYHDASPATMPILAPVIKALIELLTTK